MGRFVIMVPDEQGGCPLGEYEADFLPRVGDGIQLWHPEVMEHEDTPFDGIVTSVEWQAMHPTSMSECVPRPKVAGASATVWLAQRAGPVCLFCTCTAEERGEHGAHYGQCDNCGHKTRA